MKKLSSLTKKACLLQPDKLDVKKIPREKFKLAIAVINRRIHRNAMKAEIGSNKIQKAWRRNQINMFGGLIKYIAMRKEKAPQPKRRELFFQLINGQ